MGYSGINRYFNSKTVKHHISTTIVEPNPGNCTTIRQEVKEAGNHVHTSLLSSVY